MTQIKIRVQPNAKENKIIRQDDGIYKIFTSACATDNKANFAVIKQLSEYLDIPKSDLKIVQGHTSKNKIINY